MNKIYKAEMLQGQGIFQVMPLIDEINCMIVPFWSSPLVVLLKVLGTSYCFLNAVRKLITYKKRLVLIFPCYTVVIPIGLICCIVLFIYTAAILKIEILTIICLWILCPRTLLALGCHVGIADEHAEEKVKKMKLPKK